MDNEIQRVNETTAKSAHTSSLGGDLLAELKNVSPQERAKLFRQGDALPAQGLADPLQLNDGFKKTIDDLVHKYENNMDKKQLAELRKALEDTASGNLDGLLNAVPCSNNSMGSKAHKAFESILKDAGLKVKSIGFEAKHIGGSKFGALTIYPSGKDNGLNLSYNKPEGQDAKGKYDTQSVRADERGKIIESSHNRDEIKNITNIISSDFKQWLENKQNQSR